MTTDATLERRRYDRLTHWLLGIMAAAFLAWAGVVWKATDDAKTLLITLTLKMDVLSASVTEMKAVQAAHESLPAHPGSMQMHAREAEQIDALRKEVEKLERRNGP